VKAKVCKSWCWYSCIQIQLSQW